MKNARLKDFIREIGGNKGRFLSIFFIVLLGAAFFAGIRSTGGDMKYSADYYYDETKLMDIRVLSTLGLTDEDLADIAAVPGVETAEGGYTAEALLNSGTAEYALKIIAKTKDSNLLTLTKGREPKAPDECVMDTYFMERYGYAVGEKLSLLSGTADSLADTLQETEFTIVGAGRLPYYMEITRGVGSIGDGQLDGFLVVLPEVFSADCYSEIYVRVDGAAAVNSYSDAYREIVQPVSDKIEEISGAAEDRRYEEVYAEAKEQIADGKRQIVDVKAELADGKEKLDDAKEELDAAREKLDAAKTQLDDTKEMLDAAGQQYEEGRASYEASLAEYEEGEAEYADGLAEWEEKSAEYESAYAKAQKELEDAQAKIDEAEGGLEKLSRPAWYILDREKIESAASYGVDAERMDSLGNVFPVIFFLVAALVSLTAMTRMVEEQRMQIGTMKALGYGGAQIAEKYIGYALLATVSGAVIGIFVGEKILPDVIISSYGSLYVGLPRYFTPVNWEQGLLAVVIASLCTSLATLAACYKNLMDHPAQLMRPEAPKAGKRILLERVPFLWKRFSFNQKSTLRNLFRYKKRLIMTIIGISGCMGLMLVGFGIRDSITVVAENQYVDIFRQDAAVSVDTGAGAADRQSLRQAVETYEGIEETLDVYQVSVTLNGNGTDRTAYLYVPKETNRVTDFVCFRNRITQESYGFPAQGVALSEKAAAMLGVSAGDTITVRKGEGEERETAQVQVESIVENYVQHYAFLTPQTYARLFGETPDYNYIYLKYGDTSSAYETQLGRTLLKEDACTGISFTTDLEQAIDDMLKILDLVIGVLIIAAALLAFVVLYNLNSINMMERRRELATLKVLGFDDMQMAMYIYRENIILTLFGIVGGAVAGKILHLFTILTVEVDLMMFGRVISPESYLLCAVITFGFSLLVNLAMYPHFRKINMIESLKSVE